MRLLFPLSYHSPPRALVVQLENLGYLCQSCAAICRRGHLAWPAGQAYSPTAQTISRMRCGHPTPHARPNACTPRCLREYLANSQQTIGITLAGSVLVLIVVIGVMVFMPNTKER